MTGLLTGFFLLVSPISGRAGVFDPQSFTLANGLQVVVIENLQMPAVHHMVWYKVGAADEQAGQSGLAHLFEHLMFKGTPSVPPGQFSRIVARHGGRDNAFTSWDYTAYFQTVAPEQLELMMKMEADRLANLKLDEQIVLTERDVVMEERRSRRYLLPTPMGARLSVGNMRLALCRPKKPWLFMPSGMLPTTLF
jgi:zinc protease